MQSEFFDTDDDFIDVAAYLQVATVANSTKPDLPTEDAFTVVASSDPDTPRQTLWQEVKALEKSDVFLWCDFDSLELIIF